MALIPERPFPWMTERQRQELRLRATRTVMDFAAAVAELERTRSELHRRAATG